MKKIKTFSVIWAALGFVAGSQVLAVDDSRVPVLVELFTSQGCSSCPPADKLLSTLAERFKTVTEVIVVSEHVDYWDYLGWKDRFSSRTFTERQHSYARAFRQNNVYTPEMVVDGAKGFVGTDTRAALDAITSRSSKPKLRLTLTAVPDSSDKSVTVTLANSGLELAKGEQLVVFLTQDNLSVPVRSGENSGRVLNHTGVVRCVKIFARAPVEKFSLPLPEIVNSGALKVVAFRQDTTSMAVTAIGVTTISLR